MNGVYSPAERLQCFDHISVSSTLVAMAQVKLKRLGILL